MKIENKLRKKINTLALINNEYPKEIKISKKDFEELNINDTNFEGVKLNIIDEE